MLARNIKLLLPVIIALVLVSFGANNSFATGDREVQKGSISVCKAVMDSDNVIVDGSNQSGTIFSISGLNTTTSQGGPTGIIGTSIFTTLLTLNSKALGSSTANDAQCTTYTNLDLGNYYYGQENISSGNWEAPKYTDQFTNSANTISDFYNYDNNLFDGDPSNDGSRNTNADGHIVLEANNPNRTLIVLNQFKATPAVGGGSTAVGGNITTPGCPVDGPQKVDQVWFSDIKPGQITVNWANKGDAAGYHIQYGPSADNLPWGTEVSGNANSVTLNNIPSGDIWVTVTAKKSSDCGGPTSDSYKVGGTSAADNGQVLGVSTLAATGTAQNAILFALGLAILTTGLFQVKKVLDIQSK